MTKGKDLATFAAFVNGKSEALPETVTLNTFMRELLAVDGDVTDKREALEQSTMGMARMAFVYTLTKRMASRQSASNILVVFQETCQAFTAQEATLVKRAVSIHEDAFRTQLEGSDMESDSVLLQALSFVRNLPSPRTIYNEAQAEKKRKAAVKKAAKGEAKAIATGKTDAEKQMLDDADAVTLGQAAKASLRALAAKATAGDEPAKAELQAIHGMLTALINGKSIEQSEPEALVA